MPRDCLLHNRLHHFQPSLRTIIYTRPPYTPFVSRKFPPSSLYLLPQWFFHHLRQTVQLQMWEILPPLAAAENEARAKGVCKRRVATLEGRLRGLSGSPIRYHRPKITKLTWILATSGEAASEKEEPLQPPTVFETFSSFGQVPDFRSLLTFGVQGLRAAIALLYRL